MSLNVNGEKCVVCKAYLFPEDDVVYCPECGAPHHRECYNSIGHCGMQEFHGTNNQYQKLEAKQAEPQTTSNANSYVVCGMCGEKYDIDETACPKCDTPNMIKSGGRFATFDFSGGVPDDTDLGNGVTTQEAKLYVRVNTHRYMPKFLKFKNGGKASWNWLAFLAPSAWLMSRKMYTLGGVMATVEVALMLFMFPFIKGLNAFDTTNLDYQQILELIMENYQAIGEIAILSALIASYALIGMRVLFGIFGDLLYSKRAISKITEIKQSGEDVEETLKTAGGVNLILAAITYIIVFRLPQIFAYVLGIL